MGSARLEGRFSTTIALGEGLNHRYGLSLRIDDPQVLRGLKILANLLTSLGLFGNIKVLVDDCDEHLQHNDTLGSETNSLSLKLKTRYSICKKEPAHKKQDDDNGLAQGYFGHSRAVQDAGPVLRRKDLIDGQERREDLSKVHRQVTLHIAP
jgi:hypothetical protein